MSWVDSGGNVYITSGNVGIGTDSPSALLEIASGGSSLFRFHDNGWFAVGTASRGIANTGGHLILQFPDGSSLLAYDPVHGEHLRVTSEGRMGIGTTSPSEKLDVSGNIKASGKLAVGDGSANAPALTFASDLDTGIYSGGTNELRIATGGTLRVTVDANGNVGIGTTSPGEKLEVSGNIKSSGVLAVGDGAVGAPALTFASDPDTGLYRVNANELRIATGGSLRMTVDANGNVGIGTTGTPAEKLQIVGGNILLDNGYSVKIKALGGTLMQVLSVDSSDNLNVGGGYSPTGTELGLGIDANGNVQTNGNLEIRRSDPQFPIPLIYLGRQESQGGVPVHTNYLWWQSRTNPDGWYWGGWNTFRHPADVTGGSSAPVANGYGYYPFRNLAKNYLVEADGQIVTNLSFVGPVLYLQKPKQVDIVLPDPDTALTPTGFDSDHHPYVSLGASSAMQTPYPSLGSTTVTIASAAGLQVNDYVVLSNADASINDALRITAISGNTLTLASGTKAYPSGGTVTGLGALSFNMASPYPSLNGTNVTVSATPTGLNPSDEVLLSNSGGTVSEINQIASISGTTITLKRGTKAYASGGTVSKVRELGRVKADVSDLGVKIIRESNAMVFYDADVPNGKHLGNLLTSNQQNIKVASGITSLQHIGADQTFSFNESLFSLPSGLFSSAPKIFLTARNSDTSGEGNSWEVTLATWGVTSSQFGIMGKNNRGEQADFYVQWLAVGV